MSEADYRHVTYDLTLSVARTLLSQADGLTLVYVSGSRTETSERGRMMWARVKGATENALLALPFKAADMFRPGFIQPLYPVLRLIVGNSLTTTEAMGKAMLRVVRHGARKQWPENRDINALGR